MAKVTQGIVVAVFSLLGALALQGCGGCNDDDLKKCTEDYAASASTITTDQCGAFKSYNALIDCAKDAGCCDDDDFKKQADANKASLSSLGSTCDVSGC